jgi:hypothetical protein
MKQAKQKIRRFRRKLKGIWTIELCQDLEAMHGFDVESELADILQDEIRKEFALIENDPMYKEAIDTAVKSIRDAIDAEIINKILEKQK